MTEWISVKDRLPAKIGDACWVWGKGMLQPETDSWMGNRGDKGAYLYLAQPRFFVKSGWYFNEAYNITHWMPIERPEPPKEGDERD